MESEAAKLNAEALEILSQGNFIGAQRKFQINAKKHPGHQTFNNLGQYYFTEGLEMKNGKVRNADTLGIYQLKKAEKLQQTPLNLTNLGVAYYERAKYITYSPSDYEAAPRSVSYTHLDVYKRQVYGAQYPSDTIAP